MCWVLNHLNFHTQCMVCLLCSGWTFKFHNYRLQWSKYNVLGQFWLQMTLFSCRKYYYWNWIKNIILAIFSTLTEYFNRIFSEELTFSVKKMQDHQMKLLQWFVVSDPTQVKNWMIRNPRSSSKILQTIISSFQSHEYRVPI